MSAPTVILDDRNLAALEFEDWARSMIEHLTDLLSAQHAEMTRLSRRVMELERSAGRTFVHPSDLIAEAKGSEHRAPRPV